MGLRPELATQPPVVLWQSFVAEIFTWMELHYICPVAGKHLVLLFSLLHARTKSEASEFTDAGFGIGILRTSLENALLSNPDILESVKNYVFTLMFRSDRKLSAALLIELKESVPDDQKSKPDGDITALLHLAALEVGKKSAIVDDPSLTGAAPPREVVILDRQVLEPFLGHNSPAVRSFAVSLLITSSSITKPYSTMSFELLRRHLRSFHADPDAKFRSEILHHSKNMVKRIMNAISLLRKDIGRLTIKHSSIGDDGLPVNFHVSPGAKHIVNAGETWLQESLQSHEDFLEWYLRFLLRELVPTASYQRHITALRSLVNVLKLGRDNLNSAEQRIYQDPQWLRVILDLVVDPFDDVRETAASLLMLFPADAIQIKTVYGMSQPPVGSLDILTKFCAKAADLASRTSRADQSDGTARSLAILCAWQKTLDGRLALLSGTLDELERNVTMAEQDLGHAVMTTPVHGAFAAIRCMWEVLSKNLYTDDELQLLANPQSRIIDLCTRIWNAVSYVLCDDSPEGHLPEELEEIEGLDTKGLLSYSFRATHESSNLLRTIVGNLRDGRAGSLWPTPETFRAAGNLAFEQLSTLRHRGAFTSVSLTFTCCCQHAQHASVISSLKNRSLLQTWYRGTLACINTQRSTTRRSAGIPAMMTGILTSNFAKPSFQDVMRTLQKIAAEPARVTETDGSNLPQVHAFNCLKEIFKNSLLSRHAEVYLSECLQLATTSLKSEIWAIRNCALLLLRSLMDTLLGTTESKSVQETGWDGKTLRLSYTKYSALPPMLLNLLQSGEQAMEPGTLTQSSAAESVFPALEIIRRAGPPESNRDELYRYIAKYLGSRQWHVREIAARTLCSFLITGDCLGAIKSLLQGSQGSANRLQGTLLTVKFFLERLLVTTTEQGTLVDLGDLHAIMQSFERDALMCSETAAAYIEALDLLWQATTSEQSILSEERFASVMSMRQKSSCFTTVALLNNRTGTMALRKAAVSGNLTGLRACLFDALDKDIDTACALLEATPSVGGKTQTSALCNLYLEVCKHTQVPEARAVALTKLAELMDSAIASGNLDALPPAADLDAFKFSLQGDINPALANAILLTSGPIMAVHALQHDGQMSFFTFEQRLRAWGCALADGLHASNIFDMRMAAAKSLQSFATALHSAVVVAADAAYLPALLALYTALVDDDEEVREVGALAAAFAMSSEGESTTTTTTTTTTRSQSRPQPLVPVDAADALLAWMQRRFGRTQEFRAYVACRLVGDPLVAVDIGVQDLAAWVPAEQQFAAALEVDESLFAVEEQNLFIDEVRETERWAVVFEMLEIDFDEIEQKDGSVKRVLIMDSWLAALKEWTEKALAVLVKQAAKDDGPLGWASNPRAFALSHRVLVCGKVLSGLFGSEDMTIAALLEQVQGAGRSSRLHGLLLSTLDL
ncbi:unnamed protein product [Discula destructiva]